MSGINEIVDLIKQMRGKIIEYISNVCLGCDETTQSLREHICFKRHGICTATTIGLGCSMT
jgi:hypothetical protein